MKIEYVNVSIVDKLRLINDVYSDCYYDEPHLFNSLRKGDGSKIIENHAIYDIIHMMLETWCCIDEMQNSVRTVMNKSEYLINMHGIFQIMYVHQDLMDELLLIFRISNEESSKKRENIRSIRNELIGHPFNTEAIEGEGRTLLSTSIWQWNASVDSTSTKVLEYLYREEGSVSKEVIKRHYIENIIHQHEEYIDYTLNIVLLEMKKHLELHIDKRQLKTLTMLKKENASVELLITATRLISSDENGNFRAWNKTRGYYSYENLVEAINKMDKAKRYGYFIENYFSEIIKMFEGDSAYAMYRQELIYALNGKKEKVLNNKIVLPKVTIVSARDKDIDLDSRSLAEKTRYYISKLFEKKYYTDIDVLRRILVDYPEMISELDHMDSNWNCDKVKYKNEEKTYRKFEMEYYSALLYLKSMIENES